MRDDALAQAAEIAGGRLPTGARRVVVRVHEVDSRPTMDLKHSGARSTILAAPSSPAGRIGSGIKTSTS